MTEPTPCITHWIDEPVDIRLDPNGAGLVVTFLEPLSDRGQVTIRLVIPVATAAALLRRSEEIAALLDRLGAADASPATRQ